MGIFRDADIPLLTSKDTTASGSFGLGWARVLHVAFQLQQKTYGDSRESWGVLPQNHPNSQEYPKVDEAL